MTTDLELSVEPGGIAPERLRRVFRHHVAGVALITADAGDGPAALTATSVASLSATPPLVAFSVTDESSAAATILRADTMVIHLLTANDVDLARLGSTTGIDRFADRSRWRRLATGEPYFPDVRTWIRGAVAHRLRLGNGPSTLVIIQAVESQVPDGPGADPASSSPASSSPLVHSNRQWYALNRAPIPIASPVSA